MEEDRPVFELHPKSILICIEAKQKGLSTTTKQMHTFLLTSSQRRELWIFWPLTLHVRAVIDDSHEMNSV